LSATRLLAQELGPRIRVNAVAPGTILPPPGANQAYLEQLAESIPLRRPGTPQDVADAVVFLATAGFITGEVLSVTGGQDL
jgi:NAD(P)-dependent dehydrogenase (short-subunit alcohol dehydrogenase family)